MSHRIPLNLQRTASGISSQHCQVEEDGNPLRGAWRRQLIFARKIPAGCRCFRSWNFPKCFSEGSSPRSADVSPDKISAMWIELSFQRTQFAITMLPT